MLFYEQIHDQFHLKLITSENVIFNVQFKQPEVYLGMFNNISDDVIDIRVYVYQKSLRCKYLEIETLFL